MFFVLSSHRANAESSATFNSGSNLSSANNYSTNSTPTSTTDVLLKDGGGILSVNGSSAGAAAMESLSVTDGHNYSITTQTTGPTGSTLTLGSGSSFTDPFGNASDLIYVGSSSGLTIQGPNASSGSGTLALVLAYSGNFDVTSSSSLAISAPISGGYSITTSGAGYVDFSGSNSYSGGTTVSNGSLEIDTANSLPTSGNVSVSCSGAELLLYNPTSGTTLPATYGTSGQSLTLNGSAELQIDSKGSGVLNATWAGDTVLGSSATIEVTPGNSGTLSGTVSDGGRGYTLTVSGGGTLTLAGNNTFSGGTAITGGSSLSVAGDSQLGTAPSTPTNNITISGGSRFVITGNTTLNANRGIALTGNAENSIDPQNGAVVTYNGVISNVSGDAGFLDKVGSGVLILGGANTYTGGTAIDNGILVANTTGSGNSATGTASVSINSGGALAGGTNGSPGMVAGKAIVNSGGTITAGSGATSTSSIGMLETGTQSWNSGGTYVVKIGANNTPGAGNDELVMSGLTVGASSGSGNTFTVQITGLSNTNLTHGEQFTVAVSDSGTPFSVATDLSSSPFVLSTSELPGNIPASDFSFGSSGADLIVDYSGPNESAAPEPTSLLLVSAVSSPLLLARRRRKTRSENLG